MCSFWRKPKWIQNRFVQVYDFSKCFNCSDNNIYRQLASLLLPFCFDLAIFHAQQNDLVVQQTHLLSQLAIPWGLKLKDAKRIFILGSSEGTQLSHLHDQQQNSTPWDITQDSRVKNPHDQLNNGEINTCSVVSLHAQIISQLMFVPCKYAHGDIMWWWQGSVLPGCFCF